ncbi:MAG: MBL fold metallo-hydrolase [Candidatus Micrarchaeota archaeon]
MDTQELADGLHVIYGAGASSNIFLLENGEKRILAIDAGASPVLDAEPSMLILTHGHYDHTGGVNAEWKNVFMHKADFSGGPFFNVPKNAKPIDLKTIVWGGFELEVIHTPGHTLGSICLFERKEGILFSGDTVFADGIGRTDLGGDAGLMAKSLSLIDELWWKLLCPGHGEVAHR